jgi:hypothetical protein
MAPVSRATAPGNSHCTPTMNLLMMLNDAPYGTERTYNGLRLALNLLAREPSRRPSRKQGYATEEPPDEGGS